MAANFYGNSSVEIFKFRSSGWLPLFEETVEFIREEKRRGRDYEIDTVGINEHGNLSALLILREDD